MIRLRMVMFELVLDDPAPQSRPIVEDDDESERKTLRKCSVAPVVIDMAEYAKAVAS